jgi:hypothetical protein
MLVHKLNAEPLFSKLQIYVGGDGCQYSELWVLTDLCQYAVVITPGSYVRALQIPCLEW